MTEQHCLKVEPASLLTITEHTASPTPQNSRHILSYNPQEPLTLHHNHSVIHQTHVCPQGQVHTHSSLNMCPPHGSGMYSPGPLLHEVLFWQLAYQQSAVQQL